MPDIEWTAEQRAGIHLFLSFGKICSVLGLVLSIILIAMGNNGGWYLLAIIVVIGGGGLTCLRMKQKGQP